MTYVAERAVWNSKRNPIKPYRAKYLVEHTSRSKGQKHLLYLGMSGSAPDANIYEYLNTDDLRGYFTVLEPKERIRKVLEFFLYLNSVMDPEKRSYVLIDKLPFKNLVIKKKLTAAAIQDLVTKQFNNCGWTERSFFENLNPCLPHLWNRVSLRGKKSVTLDEFRRVVGT